MLIPFAWGDLCVGMRESVLCLYASGRGDVFVHISVTLMVSLSVPMTINLTPCNNTILRVTILRHASILLFFYIALPPNENTQSINLRVTIYIHITLDDLYIAVT